MTTAEVPDHAVHVEATAGLQWSQAIALPTSVAGARDPAGLRAAFVHRAPQEQVLALYRSASVHGDVAAPWWLRALDRGAISSRVEALRIEDRVTQLLAPRPGWEFVPWAADGESGYWEFIPSERAQSGFTVPTTLLMTDRHAGWIDVLPAHWRATPEPLAVDGVGALRSRLGEIEAIR